MTPRNMTPRRAIEVCRDRIAMARTIGWKALEASWQQTLDELIGTGHKDTEPSQHERKIVNRRISDDQVRSICASKEPGIVVAARHGISPAYVSMLRSGHDRQNVKRETVAA